MSISTIGVLLILSPALALLCYLIVKRSLYLQAALGIAFIGSIVCAGFGIVRLSDRFASNDILGTILLVLGVSLCVGVAVIGKCLVGAKQPAT